MVREALLCDGSSCDPFIRCRNDEQNALAAFCAMIGSSSICNDVLPGIADETRREAKLLMSLILTNDASLSDDESSDVCDPPTFSSSNTSLTSDSTVPFAGRDEFYFACPSLSLENPTSHLQSETDHSAAAVPALLLNRTLKVDDRDALRLSADAMARNVLQSLQTAMEWRIQAWVYALSKSLVSRERSLMESGASVEDLKELLDTPEASLVIALTSIAEGHRISVKSVSTRFDVLPQRVPTATSEETNGDPSVKRCSLGSSELDDDASSTSSSYQSVESHRRSYTYEVIHQLRLSCDVHLDTPAGFSEIKIDVPGTIQGCFYSNELDACSTLKAVTMNLDTNILASMVEKASRTIVRTSTETALSHCGAEDEAEDIAEETDLAAATDICSLKQPFTLMSPPSSQPSDVVYVTPRLADLEQACTSHARAIPSIPDDFDANACHSRRVSPQPTQTDFDGSDTVARFAPRSELKRGISDDCTLDAKRRLPLISPLAGQEAFHEVPENGPSLPLLVEVACRAMHVS